MPRGLKADLLCFGPDSESIWPELLGDFEKDIKHIYAQEHKLYYYLENKNLHFCP